MQCTLWNSGDFIEVFALAAKSVTWAGGIKHFAALEAFSLFALVVFGDELLNTVAIHRDSFNVGDGFNAAFYAFKQ